MPINSFPDVDDIYLFALPMPEFPFLATANIYAIGKGPITLIDTGPKLPGALAFLKKQLGSIGFGFSDIERIVFTHAHVDHVGLARKIIEAAGHPVDCFIHAEDKWRILKDNDQEQIWNEATETFCALANMPADELEKARNHHLALRRLFDPLDKITTIEDGYEFVGEGYQLVTIHTPGHTPGGCCFYEPSQKVLFSGDSIIKHINPLPLIEMRPDGSENPNYQSLRAFYASFEKVKRLDIRFVFSGHGGHVDNLQALIESYFLHHERRTEMVWSALCKGVQTLYDITNTVFRKIPGGNLFLAMVDIFAHLEILIDDGRVKLVDPGPPALYRAV